MVKIVKVEKTYTDEKTGETVPYEEFSIVNEWMGFPIYIKPADKTSRFMLNYLIELQNTNGKGDKK